MEREPNQALVALFILSSYFLDGRLESAAHRKAIRHEIRKGLASTPYLPVSVEWQLAMEFLKTEPKPQLRRLDAITPDQFATLREGVVKAHMAALCTPAGWAAEVSRARSVLDMDAAMQKARAEQAAK